ncbi:glycoside hydrolase [Aureobasidium pullulans]|uniref:glucan endo-1,3-beta-D-glucosidase n=2 Tax=Aureobasidium TaxID=5579 RepID=A0A4T0BJZ8_AURPU|nr:glycoside hydrolase [Aureobasidium sp. EXF-12298]KAI4771620.1 glycoside hydrolase [Aureobasidium sp. EXF-3400]TIA34208.1 glycoside hydrolase [Aureobasidium pullulans]
MAMWMTGFYTIAASISTALASYQGFNYAAQGNNISSFHKQFSLSTSLPGTASFSSARLYTMIQEGSNDTIIEAIPAALATNTKLLLGLWTSVDGDDFAKELRALESAMALYGPQGLGDLVVGISVGSEDLYRSSVLGASNGGGVGQDLSILLDYIRQVRTLLQGSVLQNVPVGHVDTLDAYTTHTNSQILDALDFVGLNIFPYFSKDQAMDVSTAADSFWKAYESMLPLSQGKPVWITETGWPTEDPTKLSGPKPGINNAAMYWSKVVCELQARCIDFWWYILTDPAQTPFFGVTNLREDPHGSTLYNLDCGLISNCPDTYITTFPTTSSTIPALYQTSTHASPALSSVC